MVRCNWENGPAEKLNLSNFFLVRRTRGDHSYYIVFNRPMDLLEGSCVAFDVAGLVDERPQHLRRKCGLEAHVFGQGEDNRGRRWWKGSCAWKAPEWMFWVVCGSCALVNGTVVQGARLRCVERCGPDRRLRKLRQQQAKPNSGCGLCPPDWVLARAVWATLLGETNWPSKRESRCKMVEMHLSGGGLCVWVADSDWKGCKGVCVLWLGQGNLRKS